MNSSSFSTEAAPSAPPSGLRLQQTSSLFDPSISRVRPGKHVLTVALEDYYHAHSFRHWIRQETWYRFEDRLAGSTRRALDLLDRCGAHATFFVDRRTARLASDLVREVANRGHEIASR